MAGASLYFIFKTIKNLLPQNKMLPIAVTCAVAFLPTFSFISATINNDNLVILLSSILVYLLISKPDSKKELFQWSVKTGIILAMLALTKMTALPLFFVVLLVYVFDYLRNKEHAGRKRILLFAAVSFGLPLALAGWWYIRNKVALGTFFPTLKDAVASNPQILKTLPSLLAGFPEIDPSATVKMGLSDFFFTKNFFIEYYKNIWGSFGRLTLLTSWQYCAIFGLTAIGIAGQIKNFFRKNIRQKLSARLGNFFASGQGILFFVVVILTGFLTWKIFEISIYRGVLGAMQGRYFLAAVPALFYCLLRGVENLAGKRRFEIAAIILIALFIINDAVSLIYTVIPTFY
jgi:hypothetical protein